MKFKSIKLLISILMICQYASAQWFLDTPTPAEIQARDQPYTILQNEIENKLCNTDWGIDKTSFLFFKDQPGIQEVVRGKSIHYFDLSRWGNNCVIMLKETSPIYQAITDSTEKVNERLESNTNTGLTQDQAMADAMKNNGNITAKDQAILNRKKAVQDQGLKDIARLGNANQFANISLLINENWADDTKTAGDGFIANAIKPLSVAGIQQAVITIEYPNEDEPDTSYRATLYIGNWPKPDMNKMLPFPFKYYTKLAWSDKDHSGEPVIENLKIYIESYSYKNLMKTIHSIDWTKLDDLLNK